MDFDYRVLIRDAPHQRWRVCVAPYRGVLRFEAEDGELEGVLVQGVWGGNENRIIGDGDGIAKGLAFEFDKDEVISVSVRNQWPTTKRVRAVFTPV